jgi:hypothetical protein
MKWRYFAAKEHPRVIRELGIPCATPALVTGMASCPRHGQPLGKVSRMCLACHDEAWAEVGRRYASAEQGRTGKPDRRRPTEAARPPLQMFEDNDPKEVTMSSTEVLEGEVLPELYEATPVPSTLFGTSDPTLAMERMALMARLLVDVVRDRKLVMKISGHEYLLAPGWAVLAGMTGLSPYTAWTRPLEDGTGYIARVEVRRISDGAVISAAEQMCSRSERKWARADEHALMGMAQTRASSRALRGPLQQIVELAGYKGTPAEEMVDEPKAAGPQTPTGPVPDDEKPTKEQAARMRELIAALAAERPDTDWRRRAQEVAGVPGNMLTRTIAKTVIEALEAELDAVVAA